MDFKNVKEWDQYDWLTFAVLIIILILNIGYWPIGKLSANYVYFASFLGFSTLLGHFIDNIYITT